MITIKQIIFNSFFTFLLFLIHRVNDFDKSSWYSMLHNASISLTFLSPMTMEIGISLQRKWNSFNWYMKPWIYSSHGGKSLHNRRILHNMPHAVSSQTAIHDNSLLVVIFTEQTSGVERYKMLVVEVILGQPPIQILLEPIADHHTRDRD